MATRLPRFLREDWLYVRSRADEIAVQLRAKGIQFEGFVGLPPVPAQQYRDFKTATGKELPHDFVELTRNFSGGWTYPWKLKVGDAYLEPPPKYPQLSSGTHDPFIWLDANTSLLDRYNRFQQLLADSAYDDEPLDEATRFLLPLDSAASGDYLALRFDKDPALVVWLDHEAGYDVSRAKTVSHGFREYVLRWATLGFPDCEDVQQWVDEKTGMIVHDDQRARDWLAWIADPAAR